jgi:hypothetical protein
MSKATIDIGVICNLIKEGKCDAKGGCQHSKPHEADISGVPFNCLRATCQRIEQECHCVPIGEVKE